MIAALIVAAHVHGNDPVIVVAAASRCATWRDHIRACLKGPPIRPVAQAAIPRRRRWSITSTVSFPFRCTATITEAITGEDHVNGAREDACVSRARPG